jgi:hypothetical protein
MRAMTSPRDTHLTRPGTTPEGELNALATIFRRAIERYEETCYAKRKAAEDHHPDGCDKKGESQDEKEKGGRHVEHLISSPSEIDD